MQVCWLAVKIDVLVDVVEHGPAECVSDVALDQRQIRPAGAALARVRWQRRRVRVRGCSLNMR